MPMNHNPVIESLVEAKIPRQVKFWDGEEMCLGILYGNDMICACCGGTFNVRDIFEEVPAGQPALEVFENWVNFSEAICD